MTDDVREKCEGKRYCEFYVGGLGPLVQSCPRDAMPYLNVWHDCVAGMDGVSSNIQMYHFRNAPSTIIPPPPKSC